MMDDDVVELGKVDGGEDASGRAAREGEMKDPDGVESGSRKGLGDAKRSGSHPGGDRQSEHCCRGRRWRA
jgi:hypothetical protein